MSSDKETLRELLETENGQLTIPAYQRRYIWGRAAQDRQDSATRLMKDLLEAFHAHGSCFLQSITLCNGNVVDGQQRLTFLKLLLSALRSDVPFRISYECRPQAQAWFDGDASVDCQDAFFLNRTLEIIESMLGDDINRAEFESFVLDGGISFLVIRLKDPADAPTAFKMLNGTKSKMHASDLVKADILRIIDSAAAEGTSSLRQLCAAEWEEWSHWWERPSVREYYCDDWQLPGEGEAKADSAPIDLLLRLCMRQQDSQFAHPLSFEEYRLIYPDGADSPTVAKRFFIKLRFAQKRFAEAFDDPVYYNCIKAILLLQDPFSRFCFLQDLILLHKIDTEMLRHIYKLSFLGMTYDEILRGDTTQARFEDLVAALSMADIYHTEAKRDAFNLLLRLNIDEDIKLGRKFDFSIWRSRSLEHIFSKSKVWHLSPDGKPLDGNDNPLRMSVKELKADPEWMCRAQIKNLDGVQLSEHCIGNLVLLYGENNGVFGNASFDDKKMMFLTPGGISAFQSRNLLHSVCVFAGNKWDGESIIDNYNLTLKNLKLYYGFR